MRSSSPVERARSASVVVSMSSTQPKTSHGIAIAVARLMISHVLRSVGKSYFSQTTWATNAASVASSAPRNPYASASATTGTK